MFWPHGCFSLAVLVLSSGLKRFVLVSEIAGVRQAAYVRKQLADIVKD
jgi:hypothetical protein